MTKLERDVWVAAFASGLTSEPFGTRLRRARNAVIELRRARQFCEAGRLPDALKSDVEIFREALSTTDEADRG